MTSISEGTYALGFQNVAVGSINRGFLQGYDYTRGDFSGFVTNPTHFGTAFFLLLYTQIRKSEITTSTGYGSVNSKRAHPPLGICHFVLEKLKVLHGGAGLAPQ